MSENKMNKNTKYLVIGILVLFLTILGSSVAYYLARVQGTLNERAAGTELDLTITKLSTNATDDLIPLDNDLETLNLAAKGYQDKGSCVDINEYSVCQIYKISVSNNGSVPVTMNGTVELYGANTPNIDCAKMDDEVNITNNASCMGNNILANNVVLPANNHLDYYVMVYINNLDEPQYDKGEFNGTVTFTTIDGKKVKGRFKREETLAQHITNLYNNAEKTVVTANAECKRNEDGNCVYNENNEIIITQTIDYNYATSVNLMNDRLGSTTTSLDDGNIRYYGLSPKNYIDIGDRTPDNEVILWRIIGVFDGKIRVIRNDSIGNYSWDSSYIINGNRGVNEWSQADLMKLLNPDYDNNQDDIYDSNSDITTTNYVNNSLYWNRGNGLCYINSKKIATSCDFTNSGLSDKAKEHIVDQTLYLGGVPSTKLYPNQSYTAERGNNVFKRFNNFYNDNITRSTSWTGKVGIMYPSDYGYATDLNICKNNLRDYNIVSNCAKDNWLKKETIDWVITPLSSNASFVCDILESGEVGYGQAVYRAFGIRPVLTLDSSVLVEIETDGSLEHPYKIFD